MTTFTPNHSAFCILITDTDGRARTLAQPFHHFSSGQSTIQGLGPLSYLMGLRGVVELVRQSSTS